MDLLEQKRVLETILKLKSGVSIKIHGNSMVPNLENGQEVHIIKKSEYCVGDVLVYLYNDESLLIHRLIKIEGNIYICRGDNSIRNECISYEDIIGCAN